MRNDSVNPAVIDTLIRCHDYDPIVEGVMAQLVRGFHIAPAVLDQVKNFATQSQRERIQEIMAKREDVQSIGTAI